MAAPTFDAAGTFLTGASSTTGAIAVPAGAAAGKVALLHLYKENTDTVTWPSGFTECTSSPVVVTGGNAHNQHIAWKRLTGADSGTYSASWTNSAWREAVATLFTGCVAAGTPLEVLGFAVDGTAQTSTPVVSGTTSGVDRLLVWSGTNWGEGAWTAPAGWTKRSGEPAAATLANASLAQAVAGATGSVSGSCTTAAATSAFLLGLIPPDAVVVARPVMGASGAAMRAGSW